MKRLIHSLLLVFIAIGGLAQPVPNVDENIPYLMTFSPQAEVSWGDDDFSQAFFFMIPEGYEDPFFIRVFDPDTGGEVDEVAGTFNSRQIYEVYGGEGVWSEPDAQETSPKGAYKSGTLLASRAFGANPRYDNSWYSFGPFNPAQGEHVPQLGGRIFKVICEGLTGDDGNMYRYYLSTEADENRPIEEGNAFAYEYSFRMHNDYEEVSHIYPYVEEGTISVKISNFDWDKDGKIMVISVARQGADIPVSNEADWVEHDLIMSEDEIKTSLDFRFVKSRPLVRNNNVVVNVRNQHDKTLPFYTVPIGGVPRYKGEVEFEAIE